MARTNRYAEAATRIAEGLNERILTLIREQLLHEDDYTPAQMDLMDARWHAWSAASKALRDVRSAATLHRTAQTLRERIHPWDDASTHSPEHVEAHNTELVAAAQQIENTARFLGSPVPVAA